MNSPPPALAYANHGRWVADCPRPHCGAAMILHPWQPAVTCSSPWCQLETQVRWPPDAETITHVLTARGAPQWMNWYPAGHPFAAAHGIPHGQTVDDLLAENAGHAAEIDAWMFLGRQVDAGRITPGSLTGPDEG